MRSSRGLQLRREAHRLPKITVNRPEYEVARHDADDGELRPIQENRSANHTLISVVAPLPQAVADQHHLRRGSILLLSKDSSQNGPHSQHGKEIRSRARTVHL